MKRIIIFSLCLLSLVACETRISTYENRLPLFQMEKFFDGKLCAWGLVRARSGEVNRKFIADIDASTSDGQVTLHEQFIFDDMERQTRIWKFIKRDNLWIGTAGDVVGEATGETAGDTLHLTYRLAVKTDGDEIIIAMDDWLHLIDERTMVGSTKMSKWGIDVGRIDIVIQKQTDSVCSYNLRDYSPI